jgi:hypothetical protein
MVSQGLLQELRVIIKEDYGIELKQDEVSELGNLLVTLYELLAKMEQETIET